MSTSSHIQLQLKAIRNQMLIVESIFPYIWHNPGSLYKFKDFLQAKLNNQPLKTTPQFFDGYQILLDPNSGIDRTVFFQGIAHPNTVFFLRSILQNNDTFFDIGSHSGYFSVLAATIIKKGQIHAFDPLLSLHKNCLETSKMNKIKNIFFNKCCLGAYDGKTEFIFSSQTDASGIKMTEFQSRKRSISVPINKLSTYCKEKRITKIDVMKIDIEGAEHDLLFSSKEIIKSKRPVIICEFYNNTAKEFGHHPNEIYDLLSNYGYIMHSFVNGKLKRHKRSEYYQTDLYCIPKEKSAKILAML